MSEDNLTVNQELKRLAGVFQSIFSQIIRLTLRKTLHGPGHRNRNSECNVDNYNYYLTNEAIGWRGQNITAVKVISKSLRAKLPVNYLVQKGPQGCCRFPPNEKCATNRLPGAPSPHSIPGSVVIPQSSLRVGKSAPTYFSPNSYFKLECIGFQKFVGCIAGRPLTTMITNGATCTTYVSMISYTDIWKQLESIGQDIIRETDPALTEDQTSRLPTALLRVYLYNYNKYLCELDTNIYDGVLDLIHLINSVDCNQLIDVISLIAITTERRWDELSPCVREKLTDKLGCEFIEEFLANEVITILIQSNQGDTILELAYGYSVMKMLYIIFGYGMITPILTGCRKTKCQLEQEKRVKIYRNKFRGARQQQCATVINPPPCQDTCDVPKEEVCGETVCEDSHSDECYSDPECEHDDECDERKECNECNDPIIINIPPPLPPPIEYSNELLNPCVVNHLQIFIELYPNINQIMVREIPAYYPYVNCSEIPKNYKFIPNISGYLRRYFHFSYCFYRSLVDSIIQQNDTVRNVNVIINNLRNM